MMFLLRLFFIFCFIFVSTADAAMRHHTKTKIAVNKHKQVEQVVNINTASLEALVSLKGVGPKKAQAIVDYRNQHGQFKSFADLMAVKGISKKFVSRLQKENVGLVIVKPIA